MPHVVKIKNAAVVVVFELTLRRLCSVSLLVAGNKSTWGGTQSPGERARFIFPDLLVCGGAILNALLQPWQRFAPAVRKKKTFIVTSPAWPVGSPSTHFRGNGGGKKKTERDGSHLSKRDGTGGRWREQTTAGAEWDSERAGERDKHRRRERGCWDSAHGSPSFSVSKVSERRRRPCTRTAACLWVRSDSCKGNRGWKSFCRSRRGFFLPPPRGRRDERGANGRLAESPSPFWSWERATCFLSADKNVPICVSLSFANDESMGKWVRSLQCTNPRVALRPERAQKPRLVSTPEATAPARPLLLCLLSASVFHCGVFREHGALNNLCDKWVLL